MRSVRSGGGSLGSFSTVCESEALGGLWGGSESLLALGSRATPVRPPVPLQPSNRFGKSLYFIGLGRTSAIETSLRSAQKV